MLAVRKQGQRVHGVDLSTLRFWILYEFRDAVLIGAVCTGECPGAQELSALHENLVHNLFRLLAVERGLYERTRRRRRGGGKRRQWSRWSWSGGERLGRELHTGVGQECRWRRLRWQLEVGPGELPRRLLGRMFDRHSTTFSGTLTAQALDQVRGISRRPAPASGMAAADAGNPALRQIVGDQRRCRSRLEARLEIDPLPGEPELEVKVLLYRAFQKALSNLGAALRRRRRMDTHALGVFDKART